MLTLRKLIELLGDEHMDSELCVSVRDPHRNTAWVPLSGDLNNMPRYPAHHDMQGRVTFCVSTDEVRFVKVKKS